jgi:type IV pilus assembly protein PilP
MQQAAGRQAGAARGLFAAMLGVLLAGCSGGQDDLLRYIDQVKAKPGGRIEPLPQVKPYETFTYAGEDLRSPFQPDRPDGRGTAGVRPDASRPKEYLEQFPLDTLRMVGTLDREGRTFALLQSDDGLVHRVTPGNFVGQNDGRVVAVTEAEVKVEELVPDGMGGFYKRPAAIGLKN